MTFDEVKQLLDAGFTKDEIMGFINPSNNPQFPQTFTQEENPNNENVSPVNNPENNPGSVPDPAAAATDQQSKEEKNTNIADNPVFSQLNENISKLIRTLQVSNLKNNSMDKPTSVDLNKQVDSIMESIIRPVKEDHNK